MNSRAKTRLATWMAENGFKQQSLAEKLGTSQSNVSAWLRGGRPALEWMIVIRDLTGIALDEWAIDESGEHAALKTGT